MIGVNFIKSGGCPLSKLGPKLHHGSQRKKEICPEYGKLHPEGGNCLQGEMQQFVVQFHKKNNKNLQQNLFKVEEKLSEKKRRKKAIVDVIIEYFCRKAHISYLNKSVGEATKKVRLRKTTIYILLRSYQHHPYSCFSFVCAGAVFYQGNVAN